MCGVYRWELVLGGSLEVVDTGLEVRGMQQGKVKGGLCRLRK